MRRLAALAAALPLFAAVTACSEGGDGNEALIKRGRAVYQANCTACHARTPSEDGPVGPAIADASEALLEAKVLHNEYPPGYTPKRDTKAMIPLPHLAPDIPALTAYLDSVKGGGS